MSQKKRHEQHEDWEDQELNLEDDDKLIVTMDGYEGPLDLLLALSRTKKIDLKVLSISQLADQYISYIENLKKHRLEIAADYLVMAAWLTYLKSKLVLPSLEPLEDEPSGHELAARLAFRLKRLDAMRTAAKALQERPQLHQDFYACGASPGIPMVINHHYKGDAYALFKAYASARHHEGQTNYKLKKRNVWSIKKARQRLQSMLGFSIEWAPIHELIAQFMQMEDPKKTTLASTFGATLEMARDGVIVLRQEGHFQPLYMKSCPDQDDEQSKQTDKNRSLDDEGTSK